MVVATEFFDRRPRREPAPARRLTVPDIQFTFTPTVKTVEAVPVVEKEVDKTQESVQRTEDRPVPGAPKIDTSGLVTRWDEIALAYTALQGRVAVATDCTKQQANHFLQHLPGFLNYATAEKSVQTAINTPHQLWSAKEQRAVDRALARGAQAIQEMFRQFTILEADPQRLQRHIADLEGMKSVEKRQSDGLSQWYLDLMERRAFLRSSIHQIKYKLTTLSQLTPRETRVAEQLDRFAALEDFPNRINTYEDAVALQAVLDELELVFASIQNCAVCIREPEECIDTTTVENLDQAVADAQTEIVSRAVQIQNLPATGSELGLYEVQLGDSVYDILSGSSYAPELPILGYLSKAGRQQVVEEVSATLEYSYALCTWIGLPFPASELLNELHEGYSYRIDLDKLHDLVTLVAADVGGIDLPDQTTQRLVRLVTQVLSTYASNHAIDNDQVEDAVTISSLDDLWPAFRSYLGFKKDRKLVENRVEKPVPKTEESVVTNILPRIRRLQEFVVKEHFGSDFQTFYNAVQVWAEKKLMVQRVQGIFSKNKQTAHNVLTILDPVQMSTILAVLDPGTEQRRWLQLHQIQESDWQRVAHTIKDWCSEVSLERCFTPDLSFGELVHCVYVLRLLDTDSEL